MYSQEECLGAGSCSDREWATIVRSTDYPVVIQVIFFFDFSFLFFLSLSLSCLFSSPPLFFFEKTGACFTSGTHDETSDIPLCIQQMDRPGIGCRFFFLKKNSF